MRSTFASGLSPPFGLAFDVVGNLFEADFGSGTIFEFTPNGMKSTFVSGLKQPISLAFEPAVVPEPSTWISVLAGGLFLLLGRSVRAARRC